MHSMVEYIDGSVVAQLGVSDMRGPISYALGHPDRLPLDLPPLDLARLGRLTFEPPDPARFPAFTLAYRALEMGGTAPAVLSGADEAAVAAFLAGRCRFTPSPEVCAEVLERPPRRAARARWTRPSPPATGAGARRSGGWARTRPDRESPCAPAVVRLSTRLHPGSKTTWPATSSSRSAPSSSSSAGSSSSTSSATSSWPSCSGVKVVQLLHRLRPAPARASAAARPSTVLALLPLGGYVKMAGDEPGAEVAPEDRGRGFLEQPPWKRFVIAFAGPGRQPAPSRSSSTSRWRWPRTGRPCPGPTLGTVMPGSPAAAGRAPARRPDRLGDRPREAGRCPSATSPTCARLVAPHPGEPLDFTVDRGGDGRLVVPVDPGGREGVEPGRDGHPRRHRRHPRPGRRRVVAPVLPGSGRSARARSTWWSAAGGAAGEEHGRPRPGPRAAAPCAPVDLEVLREAPRRAPRASPSPATRR